MRFENLRKAVVVEGGQQNAPACLPFVTPQGRGTGRNNHRPKLIAFGICFRVLIRPPLLVGQ